MTAEIVDACAAMLLVGRVGEQASIMVIRCEAVNAQIMYDVWSLVPISGLFYVSKISGHAQLAIRV
jgi:hypothetical protein